MPELLKDISQAVPLPTGVESGESSQELLRRSRANELFIAVVAPAGAGAGTAAGIIKTYLEMVSVEDTSYEVHQIKASRQIKDWAIAHGVAVPEGGGRKSLDGIIAMQDAGDKMRLESGDNAAVARAVVSQIRAVRAESSGCPLGELDGKPRAYIIDALRHPAEANLLRRLYQDAFALVGVVCDPLAREKRLIHELFELKDRGRQETKEAVVEFMERDADAPVKYGQHVTDTFHEADFFVDNSKDAEDDIANTAMNEPLRRLVKLITSGQVVRPTVEETAMHHAHSAQLRSACLSRQVGAALLDTGGNVVATGTNEVPKAGGGVYGESFEGEDTPDFRCAFRETRFCSSNREQNEIIEELLSQFPVLVKDGDREQALKALRRTRIGGLIEFSRAVHAEMDAILSAARTGVSPRGTRLFVSTFPCHYCARHIVTAGIDEVQYIEPYPKSRALGLHCDSITTDANGWDAPSKSESGARAAATTTAVIGTDQVVPKVLFRPFVGVAPRMYARVFLKDRDYKDKLTGDFGVAEPEWGGPSDIFKRRYTELEEELGRMEQ